MKIRGYFWIWIFLLLGNAGQVFAQKEIKKLTLDQVIILSRTQSPDYLMAKHRFRASYWQFRTYQAQYRPSLRLDATIPDFNKSYGRYQSQNGDIYYVSQRYANSDVSLSLSQNIGFTGGKIFLNSNLGRIDLFGDSLKPVSYNATPISIGFSQPIFSFNSYKWERKIEPMLYKEAKNEYLEQLENISVKAVDNFFELVLAQINLNIAEVNYSNNDTLYKIAQGRYNIGKIAQNELLQMELSFLNSDAALNAARLELDVKKSKFRSFLGFNENVDFELILPDIIPSFKVDLATALEEAKNNNSLIISYKRQLIEAQRDVNKSRAGSRFNANLYVTYGLTQSANNFEETYNSPQDQQRLMLGIQVPIIDWGLAKGRYKMAKSNQEVVKVNVEQAQIDFDRNMYSKVQQFNMQEKQVFIAAKSDTVGRLRYEVSKQRFYIGKIDVSDLNIALTEKDVAKRNYISALKNYWEYYFNIRQLTLFDFERKAPLTVDYNELVK